MRCIPYLAIALTQTFVGSYAEKARNADQTSQRYHVRGELESEGCLDQGRLSGWCLVKKQRDVLSL